MQSNAHRSNSLRTISNRGAGFSQSRVFVSFAIIAILLLGGCFDSPGTIKQLQQEIDQQNLDLKACELAKFECETRSAELETRIKNQPRLANVDIDDLFVVDQIKIASRSGGIDLDGKPGDEGVVVYIQPVDAAGDVIKAAGAITIQLIDLTNVGSPKALATMEYSDPDTVKKSWYGGFLTNHYSFKIPFPESMDRIPPELHVRAVFLDWLTGRELTSSKTVSVKVPTSRAGPSE